MDFLLCCHHFPSLSAASSLSDSDYPESVCHRLRYVCHTFTIAICQNGGPIVTQDTSFKPLCWLIEFVYEAFIHCQGRQPSLPSSVFPKSQHWARHARTRTEKHTLQYSAEGSGTSRRQHPVPTEWLLCHKGHFGFSLAQLPAWDLSGSLADLWP